MDPHRLSEERSIAYHRAIAARLADDPAILARARARVREWTSRSPAPHYAREWARVLSGTREAIAAFVVERSERAAELRQSSPFAGCLAPRERWLLWREVRDRSPDAP